MTHYLKIKECYADDVLAGRKKFEVRRNDRGYKVGDMLSFTVVGNDGFGVVGHGLNSVLYMVEYMLTSCGLKDGYVVLGIRKHGSADFPSSGKR